jgi:hypothetical protein
MRLTSSSNGTFYFDETSESGPLRYSRLINGKYEEPLALNVEYIGMHTHIKPSNKIKRKWHKKSLLV